MSAVNAVALLAAAGGDYQISRSVRLRSSASAYFNRTLGAGGGTTKNVFSAWIKRGALGTLQGIFQGRQDGSNQQYIGFTTSDTIELTVYAGAAYVLQKISTAVFRDPSSWYHIFFQQDTTLASAEDRFQLWINGVRITSWSTNTNNSVQGSAYYFGTANPHYIGSFGGANTFDGCLTEVNFVYQPSTVPAVTSFGETDAVTGVWKPKKYAGTYGTNGFYLNFSDNSAATAAAIGKDWSGNGNNWTPNNISVTAGVTYDSMLDVPTMYADGGNGRGNYATLNPVDNTGITLQSGNLYFYTSTGNTLATSTQNFPTSGKYYFEFTNLATNGSDQRGAIAIVPSGVGRIQGDVFAISNRLVVATGQYSGLSGAGIFASPSGTISVAQNDIIGVAIDADTNKIWIANNNAWLNSGNPSAGTGQVVTASSSMAGNYTLAVASGANANGYVGTGWVNFGQRPFAYTPPTGFKALNTQNLPEATINNGAQYMAATLWTGDGTSPRAITNGGNNTIGTTFQPDFVWGKIRSQIDNHSLFDSVRGVGYGLASNTTSAEVLNNASGYVSAFSSNGFSVTAGASNNEYWNTTGKTYVAWQWKAGGTAVSNTSGSITSSVSANTTAGFSVVTYTGTGGTATVGHGLGVAPAMIIVKERSPNTDNWNVYHVSLGNSAWLQLNTTSATQTGSEMWNSTSPTSTVMTVRNPGSGGYSNRSGANYVVYCFAAVAGYSKFGSYTGNGSADGTFIYCGFRPRYVLIKRTDSSPYNWVIGDTSRNTYNVANAQLSSNLSDAENTSYMLIDFVSNGFKLRTTDGAYNASGGTYIYACFAENPFKNSLAR